MSQKLSGKVALCWRHQRHRACHKRFVAEGAYVFITGRRQTELDAAVNEIGKTLLAFRCNLADLDRLYATIEQEQGHLDVALLMLALDNPSRSDRSPKNTLTKHSTPMSRVYFSLCRRHCR